MSKLWYAFLGLFRKPKAPSKPAQTTPETPSVPVPIPTPSEATFGELDFEIHGMENFTPTERAKFLRSMEIGKKVLNSVEFKQGVLQAVMNETRGLTNLQIWELICTGKDLYNTEEDRDIDIFITMYENFRSNTIGYTYPNMFKTWVNRKYFTQFDEAEIFGNVLHEAIHNFGFDHLQTKSKSVPYILGYLARDLAKQVMKGKVLTPLMVGV